MLTKDESLGGDGTPTVAAFTPEPFALKLGISPSAGAQLIADALDLRHRLPLLWKRVQRLQVPTWQARRVAQQTHALPLAGARWVDHQLAIRTDGALGPVITDRLVAHAIAKYDPEEPRAARGPRQGRLRRHPQPPPPPSTPAPATWPPAATPRSSRGSTTCSAPSPTSSGSTATPTRWGSARSKPSP